jgi:hypothetical protein
MKSHKLKFERQNYAVIKQIENSRIRFNNKLNSLQGLWLNTKLHNSTQSGSGFFPT